MQLSHEFGVPIDSSADYTQTKLGLTHDMLQILYRPPSYAAGLARLLVTLNMQKKGEQWCHAQSDTADTTQHNLCLDHEDLTELVQIQQENSARGRFVHLYPSSDGDQFDDLVLHSHKHIKSKLKERVQTNWRLHWISTQLAKLAAMHSPPE